MTFSYPPEWAVVCDGIGALGPETAAYVSLEAGHIVTVERNIGCTVVQNGGPAMGEIAVTVVTDDGVELVTTSTTLSWEEPVEPEGFNGTAIAFGGGGLLLLVAGITVLLMRRKQDQHLGEDGSEPSRPACPCLRPAHLQPQLGHPQPSRKRCMQNNLWRNIVDHRSQKRVCQKAGRWSSGSITARNGWHSNNPTTSELESLQCLKKRHGLF